MAYGPFLKNALDWLLGLEAELLQQKSLYYLCALAIVVVLVGGTAMFIVDPNIHSLWDGIWYAWVTITHVGFGDVVPVSFVGRVVASLLILFGIALLAMFFATFSVVLIKHDVDEVEKEESQILAELKRINERLERLEKRK